MLNPVRRSLRLSIGLPVYNGEHLLPQAIECLLAQTFGDFEIVIGDNASTDRTEEICHDYVRRDPRIRYVRHDHNLGAVANFNRVFHLSSAPLFKWAAHDDLHCAAFLEVCVSLLDQYPDAVLAHTGTAFVDERGEAFPLEANTCGFLDPRTGTHHNVDALDIGDSAKPAVRFWQVLSGARWGTHCFGVLRREALLKTRLLPNFPGNDRIMLGELALVGRFKTNPELLFLRRLCANGSWTMSREQLKGYLSTGDATYNRRARQLEAYFAAARGKPISPLEKLLCTAMVAAHCVKIAGRVLTKVDARDARKRLALRHPIATSNDEVLQ
jgi:glycosyltransferase involved in cell wall biosynthesis